MDIPPVVYVPLLIFLIGSIFYWSRFSMGRLIKQIDALTQNEKEMEKRASSIEYNYLDRFRALNESIHKLELTILKELDVIKQTLNSKNSELHDDLTEVKGRLNKLEGEHHIIHQQILKKGDHNGMV